MNLRSFFAKGGRVGRELAIIRHVAYVMLFKSHDNGILNACVLSACRRTKDGKVTASGEWIQSSTHAPEPHAVHAARRAPRCRTHRHPVTGQSAASPASAGTGSSRAGSQGQPEYDQHGSPREVSLLSLPFSVHLGVSEATRNRKRSLSRERRYSGSCASSQRETFSLTSSPRFTSRGQVVRRTRW